MRPKFSGGKRLRKNFTFGEISLEYVAFGAKISLLSSRFLLRNFFTKIDFFGVPESKLEFG